MFRREFVVRKHERGLLFRNGDFVRFLAPAVYRFFDPRRRVEIERFDLTQPAFEHRLVDYLVRWQPEAVEDLFLRVETGANQVAIVYRNGHPWTVLGPERRALYWKGVIQVKAELIDIATELTVTSRVAKALAAEARRDTALDGAVLLREVPEAHVGLLYVDGRLVRELPPGAHAFWKVGRTVSVELFDLRLKTLEVRGQEILTKDKVSVCVNLNANYRFTDAQLAARTLHDPLEFLYKTIQLGLRAAIGMRSLEALLEDKTAVDRDVFARVHTVLAALGIDVREVAVRDVRMEDDPVALRLKELEALEKITDKVGNISVYGGLDGVLDELVRLKL